MMYVAIRRPRVHHIARMRNVQAQFRLRLNVCLREEVDHSR